MPRAVIHVFRRSAPIRSSSPSLAVADMRRHAAGVGMKRTRMSGPLSWGAAPPPSSSSRSTLVVLLRRPCSRSTGCSGVFGAAHLLSRPLSSSSSTPPTPTGTAAIVNHFQVLGLPVSFSLDVRQMKANYLKLMMDSHPDRRHGAAHGDQTSLEADNDFGIVVDELASLVTKSFDVLQRPHTRALHVLELSGHPLDEKASTNLVGEAFLLNVMEIREKIAETDSNRELREMWSRNKAAIRDACDGLEVAFGGHDWEGALRLTAQLQYWNRVEETLRDKLDSLE